MIRDSSHGLSARPVGGERRERPATCLGSPLHVGGRVIENRSFLAPLSGITDVPFRRLARGFGAGLVFSEMVASGELLRGSVESLVRAMRDGPGIHVVQLAGRDPAWMRGAAERLAGEGVDMIDINMGCPAKKVVGGLSGSALMREPDLALRIVEETLAGAGGAPVTLKMRLGWDRSSLNAALIARRAEEAGIAMVTIHGRTRMDFYEGRADWQAIAAVREAVRVPLVANGDLDHPAKIAPMLDASGADALMVGRGAQGRPWLPGLLAGRIDRGDLSGKAADSFVCEHYEAMLSHYGERSGVRHARKHLGWYLDCLGEGGRPVASSDRAGILGEAQPSLVIERLRRLFADATLADLEPSLAPAILDRAA